MIERIPRLGPVGKLLRIVPNGDGWISSSQHRNLISATLLRATFYWNLLTFRGLKRSAVLQEIKLIMPSLTEGLYNAMEAMGDQHNEQLAVSILLENLQPGMVICEDVHNAKEQLVLSRGRRLTQAIIDNLNEIQDTVPSRLKIVAGSCPVVATKAGV